LIRTRNSRRENSNVNHEQSPANTTTSRVTDITISRAGNEALNAITTPVMNNSVRRNQQNITSEQNVLLLNTVRSVSSLSAQVSNNNRVLNSLSSELKEINDNIKLGFESAHIRLNDLDQKMDNNITLVREIADEINNNVNDIKKDIKEVNNNVLKVNDNVNQLKSKNLNLEIALKLITIYDFFSVCITRYKTHVEINNIQNQMNLLIKKEEQFKSLLRENEGILALRQKHLWLTIKHYVLRTFNFTINDKLIIPALKDVNIYELQDIKNQKIELIEEMNRVIKEHNNCYFKLLMPLNVILLFTNKSIKW
jgi:hypothetical protein